MLGGRDEEDHHGEASQRPPGGAGRGGDHGQHCDDGEDGVEDAAAALTQSGFEGAFAGGLVIGDVPQVVADQHGAGERERRGLQRDRDNRVAIDAQRIVAIDAETQALQAELAGLQTRFDAELAAARRVLELRDERAAARAPDAAAARPAAQIDAELTSAEAALRELQADGARVFIEVAPDTVAKVVSDRTGVPLGKIYDKAPDNMKNAITVDPQFWADHGEELRDRFNAWLAQ